jgi:hypothetical protein
MVWFLLLLLDLLGQLRQQPRGLFDLAADHSEAACVGVLPLQSSPCNGHNLIQIAFQPCRRRWLLLLLCFQQQLRFGENAFSRLGASGIPPRLIEQGCLPRAPVALGEDLRHALALLYTDSRHRRQIPHGDLRRDTALAHLLLH